MKGAEHFQDALALLAACLWVIACLTGNDIGKR